MAKKEKIYHVDPSTIDDPDLQDLVSEEMTSADIAMLGSYLIKRKFERLRNKIFRRSKHDDKDPGEI